MLDEHINEFLTSYGSKQMDLADLSIRQGTKSAQFQMDIAKSRSSWERDREQASLGRGFQ